MIVRTGAAREPADDTLISVILPMHNSERFIAQTIDSVLHQTHQRMEIIVVDDGSVDRSAEIVGAVAALDPRIRLFRIPNRGVSHARNYAIAQARGDLIATIDADDLWQPDKLEKQLKCLNAAAPSVGLVYCWSAGIDEKGRIIAPRFATSRSAGNVLDRIVAYSCVGNGSAPLMRKDCIQAVGGYDESLRFGEDWKFYIAMAEVCAFAVVPECLTGYRIHHGTASHHVEEMERATMEVTRWIGARWPDLPPSVLRLREFNINGYLAYLAIRRGSYGKALVYRFRALALRPSHLFSMTWIDFWALWIGHLIGIRRYSWRFWEKLRPFMRPSGQRP